jgi:hypothetical protein
MRSVQPVAVMGLAAGPAGVTPRDRGGGDDLRVVVVEGAVGDQPPHDPGP